jgi:iron complex transport system ATP-binding protein
MGMTPVLEARRVRYVTEDGDVLVDGVDLAFEPGGVVAIVGPNGAGKTTLLRLLAGELAPTDGEVRIDSRAVDAFSAAELASRRAVLPQHTLLQFAFTCLDVVMMGRFATTADVEADAPVVAAAMEATDTTTLRDRLYPTLSGGEQTRVSLARVLAQEAPILLLDEPTASLDLRHQELVMATMHEVSRRGGVVVVVVHDLQLAARHADRVVVMAAGSVAADGGVGEVMRPEVLEPVYGHPVTSVTHPRTGQPLIVAD